MSDIPERIGRYEVLEELGRGGMGQVFKARDPNIDRVVALKVIRLAFKADDRLIEEMRQRFRQEAKAAGVLQHPNIVTVFDAGEADDVPYIAMEFVEGETLDTLIKPDELFTVERICALIGQVAKGLAAAHDKGIIHRDIKPANVLVTKDGVAKIMDFGIARFTDSNLTQAGMVVGSPNYMSPEQITGRQVDGRSDIFSLGVLLYQLLTGERPFPGENPTSISYRIVREDPPDPSSLNPAMPRSFDLVFKKTLAKDPADRYQNALELAEDLRRIGEGQDLIKLQREARVKEQRRQGLAKLLGSGWFKLTVATVLALAAVIGLVVMSYKLSSPYGEIEPLIAAGEHAAAIEKLGAVAREDIDDSRAFYLLGHEYASLQTPKFRSSMMAYEYAIYLRPEYREDAALHADLIKALEPKDADYAIEFIVQQIGDSIKPSLVAATTPGENYSNFRHWNAAKALEKMGETIDKIPLYLFDFEKSQIPEVRKVAVEKLIEAGNLEALNRIVAKKADVQNQDPLIKNVILKAEEKINATPTPIK